MSGETTFAKIKFAEAADEVNKFPVNVSEPGAKTIDKYLEEHTLTFKTRAASYEAKSGEFGVQTSNAKTTTLPAAATASQFLAVCCKTTETKVTTSGGAFIIGKAELTAATEVAKVATVTLTEGMTAFFFSDGTNWELWGQIKQEQKYSAIKAFTKAEAEAEVETSAARPALLTVVATEKAQNVVSVGAVTVAQVPAAVAEAPVTVLVPPGQKWKATRAVEASWLLL